MPTLNRAPNEKELEKLISIYLRAETAIINEIGRLRSQGLVDYHAVAALERVQAILRRMESDCWEYVPKMIEKQFYVRVPEARKAMEAPETAAKHAAGYYNAGVGSPAISASQYAIVDQLVMNLMGEITDATITAMATVQSALIGRVEPDVYRRVGLEQVALQQATGRGTYKMLRGFVEQLRREGVTAFVDKAGRHWSLHTYCSMVSRTTSRQAEVLAVLTADPEQDLYRISSHGTTCAICAPFEGRVYSKSGTNPDYPPLAAAFGKQDPNGPDTLANTWLNIHPDCLVPGGTVLAEGVMAHSCREYDGPVITLVTSKGNRITVTPNHPILTPEGFVPAGMLQEGQEIIEATGEYRLLLGKAPNDINIPTPVEEIGHSIIQTCGGTTVRVKGSPVQFHGDGSSDSEVNIVFPERFRVGEGDVFRCKPVREKCFPSAHFRRLFLLPECALFQFFNRALCATHSVMSRFGLVSSIKLVPVDGKELSDLRLRTTTSLCDFCKCKPLVVEFKKTAELLFVRLKKSGGNVVKLLSPGSFGKGNPKLSFNSCENFGRKPKFPTKFRTSDPLVVGRLEKLSRDGVLVVSKLSHISTSEYHGLVYNLQTRYGFYVYNNIVTHNCLHSILPYTTAGRSEEEIQKIKDFSDPRKNPFSRDPRTEKQIKAYRAKEAARRRWLSDYRQWERYRMTVGDPVPKTFATWQKHKGADDEKYREWERLYREANRSER